MGLGFSVQLYNSLLEGAFRVHLGGLRFIKGAGTNIGDAVLKGTNVNPC